MAKKAVPNDRYRLLGTYERLRRTLFDLPDDGRLGRPLSFWVLPSDRRLPIAFLDEPVQELLSRPLEELMSTPGVGKKKILGFFDLLRRASRASDSDAPFGFASSTSQNKVDSSDSVAVSEVLWSTWCETVNRCGFREEKLGRIAPSLQHLPTVIWRTPLSEYADLSLAAIRQKKTHGEKRVQAILEVFRGVHEAVSTSVLAEKVDLCLVPSFVPSVSSWLVEVGARPIPPDENEIQSNLVTPLADQIANDLGPTVAGLVADRLQLGSDVPTVKQQAEKLGVTRARVYQLLDDCTKVMEVRWPEGRFMLAPLAEYFNTRMPESVDLIHSVHELFFPEYHHPASPKVKPARLTDR